MVTNRFLGLPIFFVIMTLMYYISITTIGSWMTDWTNDVFFGEIVTDGAKGMLESMAAPEWLSGLVVDGIIGGVGTVLGFVPQILLIFFFMSLLEDSGYMARVAFIMDRIFRQFGLSGKSFIPVLIGMGCGVPAIMAARTIEEERDRRMTILLATFIPCGAKAEIIGMITAVFFPNSVFMAPGMYFLGLAIIVLAGIALKKTSWFAGEPAPFVMELPAYHMPSIKGVLIHMWERARGFIIKAGMIIFPICVLLWFMQNYNFSFEAVEEMEGSILGVLGNGISWIFAPIGLGDWKATVASIAAFLAKEDAVGVLAESNGSVHRRLPGQRGRRRRAGHAGGRCGRRRGSPGHGIPVQTHASHGSLLLHDSEPVRSALSGSHGYHVPGNGQPEMGPVRDPVPGNPWVFPCLRIL